MNISPFIYIASPLGFSEVGRKWYYEELIPILKEIGFEILDPWELTPLSVIEKATKFPYGIERKSAWKEVNRTIGRNNERGITKSDFILAILDGVDVDSGTASEIGYGYAKGKIVIGYRGDFRLSADNEGSTVNLQVEWFIYDSEGKIVTSFHDLTEEMINQYNHFQASKQL